MATSFLDSPEAQGYSPGRSLPAINIHMFILLPKNKGSFVFLGLKSKLESLATHFVDCLTFKDIFKEGFQFSTLYPLFLFLIYDFLALLSP